MLKRKYDPAFPLPKDRHESFAQNVARGMNNGAAYLATIPPEQSYKGGLEAAKVTGHRLRQKAEVEARISWLIADDRRRKRALESVKDDIPKTFTRDDILRLFVEVSETLHEAYLIAQNSSVPPIRLQQLRAVYADHTARMARIQETHDIPVEPSDDIDTLIHRINRMEVATCRT